MTYAEPELGMRASRRNALVRQLYVEFPQVPAGFVADAVLQASGDLLADAAPTRAAREELVERRARERLLEWNRRAEAASRRVGQWRRSA
jgi:hypothetical protein